MGLASAVAAVGGAAFVALVPADALKITLGVILIASALKVFRTQLTTASIAAEPTRLSET
jgi:uncharacterized membrane protein YfcA